jgi:hypothetical protein
MQDLTCPFHIFKVGAVEEENADVERGQHYFL